MERGGRCEMRDRGKGAGRELTKGIVRTNPLLVLMVGLCSALAISTRVESCIFMGAAVIFVTVCSNVIISLIRGFIPDQIRIPIFIVVIASFVTIVDLTLKTQPAIYERLGVWIPLIVVNCLILARAEGFASGSGVYRSFMDGLGIGLGYTVVILIMSVFRELFGTGKIVALQHDLNRPQGGRHAQDTDHVPRCLHNLRPAPGLPAMVPGPPQAQGKGGSGK